MSRLLTGTIVAGMMAAGLALTGCRNAKSPATSAGSAEKQANAAMAPSGGGASKRVIFPWSVVSGGVDSAAAMGRAMENDPVVASHYGGLNPTGFKREVLAKSQKGYVSYRIRDKVYWTRRMVTIAAGESVLSDGRTMVRGRCGNLVSPTPREPVAPDGVEPSEHAMDVPASEVQLMTAPPLGTEVTAAAETFVNPRQLAENREITSVLPSPEPMEPLPPAYVSRGSEPMAFLGGAGGGGAALVTPGANTPPEAPTQGVPVTGAPLVPGGTNTPPLEVPPPMVLTALTASPEVPWIAPPPEIFHGPVWDAPPAVAYRPLPPVTGGIPPSDTPLLPPIVYPPLPEPPPPVTTPPTVPPPSVPPAKEPPPPIPPPTTPNPPPVTPVPEPGAWVLLAMGLAGMAAGLIRKKT